MISTTLHMGLPKTGSTTVQVFFRSNRKLLRKHGILYPLSIGNTAHRKLLLLAGSKGYGRFDAGYVHTDTTALRQKALRSLREEIEEGDTDRVILSCENMARVPSSVYHRLRLSLEECGLRIDRVILFLRPQADWRRSVIQQRIKVGIWDDDDLYPVDTPEACGTYGCYRDHVERRAAAFGTSTIRLRLFGTSYFKDGDFYRELRDAFELPEAPYEEAPPTNESLSDFACRMLLQLNKSMPRYSSDGLECPRRRQIRKAAAHFLKASKAPLGKAPLSMKVNQQYEKYYRESNEWIRRNFFPQREQLFDRPASVIPTEPEDASVLVTRAQQAAQQVLNIHGSEAIDEFFAELRRELAGLTARS